MGLRRTNTVAKLRSDSPENEVPDIWGDIVKGGLRNRVMILDHC